MTEVSVRDTKPETKKPEDSKFGGLLTRIVSALVLLPIVLWALYEGHPWFSYLLFLAGALLSHEWLGLIGFGRNGRIFGAAAYGIFGMALFAGFHDFVLLLIAVFVFALSLFIWAVAQLLGRRQLALAGSGVTYIWWPIFSMFWIRTTEDGLYLTFWILLIVWLTDIGGYFVGKTLGGPKLAPVISPKKTWSGFAGGIGLSVIGSLFLLPYIAVFTATMLVVLTVVLSVMSQIGDLYESRIKRAQGIKESGGIIPGHGGILDRVDGLLFAAPFGAALIFFLGAGGAG